MLRPGLSPRRDRPVRALQARRARRRGRKPLARHRGVLRAGAHVGDWLAEKRDFAPGIFPVVAKDGNPRTVGHYTQIVWRETTKLGCATASSKDWDVLVCRYSPPGNTIGQRVY
ncbi:MAG: hypothetical protein JOZ72_14450 [Alphaproteobacteria bacterium]|nr:hypothetical protein [Alphaproteobacteria bacterium]